MAAMKDFRSDLFWLVLIYKSTQNYLSSLELIGRSVKKYFKIDLQDGSPDSHHGFPIRTI